MDEMVKSINMLKTGSILKFKKDGELVKVIGFDDVEVFYDSLSYDGTWMFANLKRAMTYYRLPTDFFIENTELLDVNVLSDEEKQVFRPDLPFRFFRDKNLSWREVYTNAEKGNTSIPSFSFKDLDIDKIYINSCMKSGRFSKSILINTKEQPDIEILKIISKAQVEALKPKNDTIGVGIFRCGSTKKIPSFYLWGYIDQAEYLK